MVEPFVNDRLLDRLRVRAGRRQFVLTGGGIEHEFMIDLVHGLKSLDDALKLHAARQKYEVAVFLDDRVKLEFLTPNMSGIFYQVVRGVSCDSRAGDRQVRTFTPRARRGDGDASGSVVPGSVVPGSVAPSENRERAAAAAQEVSESAGSAEQATLDQLTRLLNSDRKSMVVFLHPEKMWQGNPTTADLRKLETIIGWCRLRSGHPGNISILVVNPNRLKEFVALADRWGDRADFTSLVELGKPGRRELECFLIRVLCRYGLAGDTKQSAETAFALQMSLYNFRERIADFLRDNPHESCLDRLFAETARAKTLEQLLAELSGLIGLTEIKRLVLELIHVAKDEAERRRLGQHVQPLGYHMFFLGNPGTGKTIVARLIGQIFWSIGLRSSQAFVEISPSTIISAFNPGDTIQNMKEAVARAMGGVLFIDEVYGLAEDDWGRKALEALMKEMEDQRENLTVIMAGYEEKLPALLKVNPGFKSRVNRTLRFPDYSTDELMQMFDLQACECGWILLPEAREKLRAHIESFNRMGGIGNGRGVRSLFERVSRAMAECQSQTAEIRPEMVPDPICFREAEAQMVLAQLDQDFIGLGRVKEFFRGLFLRQRARHLKGGTAEEALNHCVFLGNPGTGKTSVARRMGRLFYFMGLVSEPDRFVEIDPISDMTSKYQSEYAEKVRDCFDRAVGGVLFIDEAYQLAENEQGHAVIDQIVKLTTEPRYRNLVVILAGYPDEMQGLYKANPGLKRRFPNMVSFDDFSADELCTVFDRCLERDKHFVAEAEHSAFHARLRAELQRLSRQRHFGNAGAVQSFYETVKVNQERRLLETPSANPFEFRAADLSPKAELEDIEAILDEMDREFIGLAAVKEQIRRLARRIKFDRIREQRRPVAGSPNAVRLYHMRFTGPPGTGKTTIACYMARVFYSLGITTQPKVRELRGVDLKGSYLGQTKDRVNQLFETACGQVVLIDEIYGLQSPSSISTDSYGQEAIDTLVGCVTDQRNEGTVIILAGYQTPMREFLSANPGLASRFPNEIDFPDYTAEECAEILFRLFDREGYRWPQDNIPFRQMAVELFATRKRSPDFGNARTAAYVFEQIKDTLDQRAARIENPTADDLLGIEPDDLRQLLEPSVVRDSSW